LISQDFLWWVALEQLLENLVEVTDEASAGLPAIAAARSLTVAFAVEASIRTNKIRLLEVAIVSQKGFCCAKTTSGRKQDRREQLQTQGVRKESWTRVRVRIEL
jgi:hypothetical protein